MEDNMEVIEMTDYINFSSNVVHVSDAVEIDLNDRTTSNLESQYIILNEPHTSTNQLEDPVNEPHIAVQNKEDDILQILTAWRLPQLLTTMRENEVDVEALQAMQKHHADELLRGQSLGTQIKFMQNLFDWQRVQGTQRQSPGRDICSCSISQNRDKISVNYQPATTTYEDQNISSNSENVLLKQILEQTIQGKSLLSLSAKNLSLSDSNRSILVDLIVTYYINNNLQMGVNQCEAMASQIEIHFPSETSSVFFQRRKNLKSKGQLYDRYNNRMSKLRRSSLIPKPLRYKRVEPVEPDNISNVSLLNDDDARILCENLKFNRDDSNLDLVSKNWTSSADYRIKWIKTTNDQNIDSIIKEWPAYSQSYGPMLIDIDFTRIYPESENIFLKFDRFCNDVLIIMADKVIEPTAKQMLKEFKLQKYVTPEARTCVILLLLHALIKPSTKRKTVSKQLMKFTIKDAQNSFMVLLPSSQEADKFINNQKQMSSNNKLKLQPFIFIIGENLYSENQFYVYCDKIRYKCVSPLAALDCTFKLFHVFNLEYPLQSKAVWQFIQTFFYNIVTKYDDAFPAVNLLISKLKNKVSNSV